MYTNNNNKYQGITFEHLVIFNKDRTVFGAARNADGKTRLFLIFEDGQGNVYSRNGREDSWEHLSDDIAATIRGKVALARNNHIPVYHINGSNKLTTGGTNGSIE